MPITIRLACSEFGGRLALLYINQMHQVNSRYGNVMMTAP